MTYHVRARLGQWLEQLEIDSLALVGAWAHNTGKSPDAQCREIQRRTKLLMKALNGVTPQRLEELKDEVLDGTSKEEGSGSKEDVEEGGDQGT